MTSPAPKPVPVRTALVSVADKRGLADLAPRLRAAGAELAASGGTRRHLEGLGLPVVPVERLNGRPEAFGGLVKTLGFPVAAGVLYDRDDPAHAEEARRLGVRPIDLVVCNLYPFAEAAARGADGRELLGRVDVGGPALSRAAAKNHRHVAVLSDPADYGPFMDEVERDGGSSPATRGRLAAKAFVGTYHHDQAVALALAERFGGDGRDAFPLVAEGLGSRLRYGENPHQGARLLAWGGLARARTLQGKAMSHNNYLDADQALGLVADLSREPAFAGLAAAAVVKHGNPCGAGLHADQARALELAWSGDPGSGFGGVVCAGGELSGESARWAAGRFLELLVAPSFSREAREVLRARRNLRLVEAAPPAARGTEVRSIDGGLLVQDPDDGTEGETFAAAAGGGLDEADRARALFGVLCCKWLKSNAVVLVGGDPEAGFRILGAGMGSPSRVASAERAVARARANGVRDLGGAVAAGDAFFPFRDGVEVLGRHGVRAVVAPGGSVRDGEVAAACRERGMTLALTGRRHLRH